MTPFLTCRFYEKHFPEKGDVVMVREKTQCDMGVYTELLEYDDKEGLIVMAEISRRRIRSPTMIVRPGSLQCCTVVRVDPEKGYIDLSKRRVSLEEKKICKKKFLEAKSVNNILKQVAVELGYTVTVQLEKLYDDTAWHFVRTYCDYGAAYSFFKDAAHDPSIFDECNISPDTAQTLVKVVQEKLHFLPVRIKAGIALTCIGVDGIDGISDAVQQGLKLSTEEMPIKIKLKVSPNYEIKLPVVAKKTENGMQKMREVIDSITDCIERYNGSCEVKTEPYVITSYDIDDGSADDDSSS